MIYLYQILYNGKNVFPVPRTVAKRVQETNLKITSDNKRKMPNVKKKKCLIIFWRWKDVKEGKKILRQIIGLPVLLHTLISTFPNNKF